MPQARQVQLSLLLAEDGARFVIVGSTARLLRGATRTPRDLDIVALPMDRSSVATVLARLTVPGVPLRPDSPSPQRLITSWSPVDVFLQDEPPDFHTVEIDGTTLQVADE